MKFIDLIFAVTVLIAGSIATYSAIDRIQHIEKPSNVLIERIALGKSALFIKYHESCIGKIELELSDDKSSVLKMRGDIAASLKQQRVEVPLSSTAIFNPLGQMTDFQFKIEAGNIKILFKTEQVKPIAVYFQITGLPKEINLEYSLPGPVMLKDIDTQFKQILWEGELPFASLNIASLYSNSQSSPLRFETVVDQGETCQQALELDTFLSMVPKLMESFRALDVSTLLSGQLPTGFGVDIK